MLRTISRTLSAVRINGRQLAGDERGSVTTFLVIIPVLVGVVALGAETGQLYRMKRQMQSAADAGAIAGAMDRISGKTTDEIVAAARYEAQRNGFADGVSTVSVTVNSPPTSGSNINTTGAVEVIVTKTQSFSLGAVLVSWMGGTNSGFTMRARAVAAQGTYTSTTTSYEGCIVALTTAAEQGVRLTSFNNFTSDCSILSNGTATSINSNASIYMANFNTASLGAGQVWTRGSFYKTSYNQANITSLTNQASSAVDPYVTLANPQTQFTGCTYTNYSASSGSALTLSPGWYCGGLSVSSWSNVYFTKGTYYIANGDLYMTSINNVSCSDCTNGEGVTFVLTTWNGSNAYIGGVIITSENNVTLSAPNTTAAAANPTRYPFGAGVLFYQDRNASVGTMSSTSKIFTLSSLNNARLSGAIYFPNNRIDISSLNNAGTGTDGCTVWIGRYIKFSSYNNNYSAGCASLGTTPVGIPTTSTVDKAKIFE